MLRYLMVGVVLVGCAWGQSNPLATSGTGTVSSTFNNCSTNQDVIKPCGTGVPMDVPAIEESAESHTEWIGTMNGMVEERCANDGKLVRGEYLEGCVGGHKTTCADKRRVLLTDEGGRKHCILFPSKEGE